jgi:molybdopterin/thiamine biosynthesis adenylyltransferase
MKMAIVNKDALARFDRQVRAFGKEGQEKLAALNVAIVGLGGIGGIVAEELARLGVGHFVLIDHDAADPTSQNRLPGLSVDDVARKLLKVDLAKRQIRIANPDAVVEVLPMKIFNREAIEAAAEADLIVCGTDDSASRFAVNEVSLSHLRPYMDIATGISTESGKLAGVGGRYTFTFPGSGCLLCAQAIDPTEAAAEFTPAEVRRAQERDGYIQGSTEPAASVMPLNALVASQAVFEVLAWVTGVRAPIQQRFFDALQGTVDRVTFSENPRCIACRGNLGLGTLAALPQKYSRWSVPTGKRARQPGPFRRILMSMGLVGD